VSIIAVANQKGGVGKTTTAVSLDAALGALERRVLLVDCDPQGNASAAIGIGADAPNLYHAMAGQCDLQTVIRHTEFPGLDIVPSNRDLVGLEVELVGLEDWELRLRGLLEPVSGYDAVLLDCPPSLGHLTVNALAAADGVLVPMQCEYLALEGIAEIMGTIERVRESLNSRLVVAGILLTMYDERTRLSREVRAEIRRHFPDQLFATIVPRNIRLAEAPSHGLPVLQYDITSRGAQAYLAVAREFLRKAA